MRVLYVLDDSGLPDAHLNDGGDLWYVAIGRSGLGLVFLVVGAVIPIGSSGFWHAAARQPVGRTN